jgi:acetylornithine deacetylase
VTPAETRALAAAVAAGRDASEAFLAELVAIRSVRGESTTIHQPLERALGALGFEVERIVVDPVGASDDPEWSPPPFPGTPVNLLATRPGDRARGLVLFAHLDTEPVPDPGAWDADPWTPRVRDGRMVGVGTADDKAGVASIVAALRALEAVGRRPAGLTVALVHAKGGGALGTLPAWRRLGARSGALYVHPAETGHGLAEVKTGSRGLATFRLTVTGRVPVPVEERTPVSADPRRGWNALDLAWPVIREVRRWARSAGPGAVIVTPTDVRVVEAVPWQVADRCILDVATWFTSATVAEHEASLRAWLADRFAGHPWLGAHPVDVELTGLRAQPAVTRGDDAFLAAVRRAVRDVTGRRPTAYGHHAASDIRFPLRCGGTPAVGLGPTGGGFYGPGEWVDLRSFHDSTEIVARIAWGSDAASL